MVTWGPLWPQGSQMGLKAGELGGQLAGPMDGKGGAIGTDRLLKGIAVVVNHGNKAPVVGGKLWFEILLQQIFQFFSLS